MTHGHSRKSFGMMAFRFRVRDFFSPPGRILAEAGIRPGDAVLDFGSGTGSFLAAASRLAGENGRVYALDRQEPAMAAARTIIARRRLMNAATIHSDGPTGLPDGSVDVVLLYDTFHALDPPDAVMSELRRVLKPGGTLSFSDHHLADAEIRERVRRHGFDLVSRGRKTYRFRKPS